MVTPFSEPIPEWAQDQPTPRYCPWPNRVSGSPQYTTQPEPLALLLQSPGKLTGSLWWSHQAGPWPTVCSCISGHERCLSCPAISKHHLPHPAGTLPSLPVLASPSYWLWLMSFSLTSFSQRTHLPSIFPEWPPTLYSLPLTGKRTLLWPTQVWGWGGPLQTFL